MAEHADSAVGLRDQVPVRRPPTANGIGLSADRGSATTPPATMIGIWYAACD
jgi:hypothetical protein